MASSDKLEEDVRPSAAGFERVRPAQLSSPRLSASRDRQPQRCGAFYATLACLAPLVAAMSLGFTSPALDTMKNHVVVDGEVQEAPGDLVIFSSSGESASWFSSLVNIGALLGALGGGWSCDKAGRRGTLQISAWLIGCSWAVAYLTKSATWLLILRVIIGLGVGLQSVATPMFIAEVSPVRWRGALGTLNAAAILCGVLVIDLVGGSWLRAGDHDEFCDWRNLAIFISASAVLFFFVTFFFPQSANACAPCSPSTQADTPSIGVVDSVRSISGIYDNQTWKLVVAGLIPMVWQQLSGINAVIFFGQSILASAGIRAYNVLGTAVIAVQLTGIAVAASLIDRLGRRPLLVLSTLGMALGAALLGCCLRMESPPSAIVVATLAGYVLSFAIGLGPVPWLLLPELGLPRHLRSRASSVATATNWACSFIVTGPPLAALQDAWGLSGTFLLFGIVCLLGSVLIMAFVPETRQQRRAGLERRLSVLGVQSSLLRRFSLSRL